MLPCYSTGATLGRVQHDLVRYECQGRGSLHAHILLWVHPDDIDRVSKEITASIPVSRTVGAGCTANPFLDTCHDATQERLRQIVLRKQVHKCRHGPGGCMHQRATCQHGFPFVPNPVGTRMDPEYGQRYVYFRADKHDENIVPYHPMVLLLWNGHMNIQVTGRLHYATYLHVLFISYCPWQMNSPTGSLTHYLIGVLPD